jgi:hypothetical protein
MPTRNSDADVEMGELPRRDEICIKSRQGACERAVTIYPDHRADLGGTGPLGRTVTIATLPDDCLLEIFSFYVEVDDEDVLFNIPEDWQTLVHVCQRWRSVVFASPRRLNLRLSCTSGRRVREMLQIWPPLPIVIEDTTLRNSPTLAMENVDNIVAAFQHRDRVHEIKLHPLPLYLLELISPMMQEPFPALEFLTLHFPREPATVLPDSFLGGCAPLLRCLALHGVPFPGLPKLLLSTNNLVELYLGDIPHSGYISPEAMITSLSSSINLRTLSLYFNSSQSQPDDFNPSLPSLTRVDLPNLVEFRFKGTHDYLEDFVARINAPELCDIKISLFCQPPFDATHLIRFIGRIEGLGVFHRAYIAFYYEDSFIKFENAVQNTSLELRIASIGLEAQISSLAQICHPFSSLILPKIEHLKIAVIFPPTDTPNNQTEIWLWSQLLRPFTAVTDLRLLQQIVSRVVRAMQDSNAQGSEELLPALRSISVLSSPFWDVQAAFEPLISARKDSGHPVAVFREIAGR